MQVGVIGVGRMGGAMARNLLKAGHRLTVFDMAKEPVRELAKEGVSVAASAKEAFAGESQARRDTTRLNDHATPMPMAINVNMLGLRLRIESQPRAKNGAPAQSTTGVESTACTTSNHQGDTACCSG